MFTLPGLILEARENLFRDFWSPFSISFYFSSERKKNGTDYGPYSARTPQAGAFISRGKPAQRPAALAPNPSSSSSRQPPPPPRRRSAGAVRRPRFAASTSMPLKKIRSSFSFSSDLTHDFSDLDSWSDFRFNLIFRSFIGIRRFKCLEFRLETLFPNNLLKQVFAIVKFDLDPD